MKRIALLVIILLSLFLRTNKISSNPPSLSWDEVSIGYNAYSILKTGRDEHGRLFPLDTFIAYGDYKPPISIYATVPFVAMFGLNEMAVRFPSALFGTLTVLCTYFLVRELLRMKSDSIALLSSAVLAISPWHINISRAGFEANLSLFFTVVGIWLLLSSRQYPKRFIFSFIPFVLSIYTFNSSRIFSLLLVPGLLLYLAPSVKKHFRFVCVGLVLAGLLMIPIAPHLVSKEARLRFDEVNIFTDKSVIEKANARIEREKSSIVSKIIHNRRVGYARSFVMHFVDHFQPEYLFIRGDGNPKFSIQDVGQLYIVEAPFLIIGIFALLFANPKVAALLLFWLFAAIVPAAFARETPHALRTLHSLPTWHIFIAVGIATVIRNVYKFKLIAIVFFVLIYTYHFTYYIHTYYRHYPLEFSAEWQYGYREAIQKSIDLQDKYNSIVVSEVIGRPYMYALFYTETDPSEFIRTKDSYFDAAGFYHVNGFSAYKFTSTLPDPLDPNALYVWDAGSVPKGTRIIDTVRLLNGNPVLVLFDTGTVSL